MGTRPPKNPGDSPPEDEELPARQLRSMARHRNPVSLCPICNLIRPSAALRRMQTRHTRSFCTCTSTLSEGASVSSNISQSTKKKLKDKPPLGTGQSTEVEPSSQTYSDTSTFKSSVTNVESKFEKTEALNWSSDLTSSSEKQAVVDKPLKKIDVPDSVSATNLQTGQYSVLTKKESDLYLQVSQETLPAQSHSLEHEVYPEKEGPLTEPSSRVTRSRKTFSKGDVDIGNREITVRENDEKESSSTVNLYIDPIPSTSQQDTSSLFTLGETYDFPSNPLYEKEFSVLKETDSEIGKNVAEVSKLSSPIVAEEYVHETPGFGEEILSSQTEAPKTPDAARLKKIKTRHICPVCQKTFGSPGKLSQHMYSHTGERPFKCTQCHKAFSSKFKLVRHVLIHSDERKYKCTVCERMFHRKDHLKNHVKVHNPIKKTFLCEKEGCGKEYSSLLSYRKHAAVHSAEEGILDCKMCGKSFASREEIFYHLKVHAGSRTVKNPSDKKYRCDFCERRFFTRKDVRRHLVVHTGKRDFLCQFCPQRFGRKDHLVRHIKKSHNAGAVKSKGKRQRAQTTTTMTTSSVTAYTPIQPAVPSSTVRKLIFISSKSSFAKPMPFLQDSSNIEEIPSTSTSEPQLMTFTFPSSISEGLHDENFELVASVDRILRGEHFEQSEAVMIPPEEIKSESSSLLTHSEPVLTADELVPSLVYHTSTATYPVEFYQQLKMFESIKVEQSQIPVSEEACTVDLSQFLGLIPSESSEQSHSAVEESSEELKIEEDLRNEAAMSLLEIGDPGNLSGSCDQLLQLMESSETLDLSQSDTLSERPDMEGNDSAEVISSLLNPNEEESTPNTTPLPGFSQAFHQ